MRGDPAVDHRDARARRHEARGARREEGGRGVQRAARRLEDMVVIGIEPGRRAPQPVERLARRHPPRNGQRHQPHPEERLALVADHAETGLRGGGEAGGVGLDHHQPLAPHGIARTIAVELAAMLIEQQRVAQRAKVEQGFGRSRDRRGERGDAVEPAARQHLALRAGVARVRSEHRLGDSADRPRHSANDAAEPAATGQQLRGQRRAGEQRGGRDHRQKQASGHAASF